MAEHNKGGGRPFEKDILPNGLTLKQEAFCLEYVKDWNKSAAAIRAGFSEESAGTIGYDLYTNHERVRERIKELLRERRKEYEITEERMQQEIARIAFSDPSDFIQALGGTGSRVELKSLDQIPKKCRAAIKSIVPTKYGIKVEFHNKVAALDMLARHFGYYEKDNEQKQLQGTVALLLPDNGRGDANLPVREPEPPNLNGPDPGGLGPKGL